jgi:hypothetical protein
VSCLRAGGGQLTPGSGKLRLLRQAVVKQHLKLLRFQWVESCVCSLRPPTQSALREALETTRKRQNTYVVNQLAAEQATIVDPTHPLFGQTLPILRASRHHLKERIVVALPDGRERRIPVSITNLVERLPDGAKPVGLISIRTLLPLIEFIRAMVASQEDNIHGATSHSKATELPRCNKSSEIGLPINNDNLEQFGSESSDPTDTVPGRVDSPHPQDGCGNREGGR